MLTEAPLRDSITPAGEAGPATGRSDSVPRTAALRWFDAAFLLILGMSFLILPRGPSTRCMG